MCVYIETQLQATANHIQMLIRMHSGQEIRHMLIVVTAAFCQCKDAVGAGFASHCFLVIIRNQSGGLFRALLMP